MSALAWLEDRKFEDAIDALCTSMEEARAKAARNLDKNIRDPFLALSWASLRGIDSVEQLEDSLELNIAMTGVSSAIGRFHERILGSVHGWKNHDAGFDLINESRKELAEIKNKHNTMNASNREKVIYDLGMAVHQREKGKDWHGFLVIIIPKKPERYKKLLERPRVFEMDGASFYEKATGDPNALHDLFDALAERLEERNRALPQEVRDHCADFMRIAFSPREAALP